MVRNEKLSYSEDGVELVGQFYFDDALGGARPGILVYPEIFGLGAHAKSRAERLAGLGYAVLACDFLGGGKEYSDMAEAGSLVTPLRESPARMRARAQAGLDALAARAEVDTARIAAIGYCFGGTMALELARSGAPLRAAVGFHSGLGTPAPQDAKNITGKVLVCIGADDPVIPAEQRAAFEQEMRAGGVDWSMQLYGGVVHSFTNKEADERGKPELARYSAVADARSWAAMIELFDEVF
jgi:dienelactone hydrolase